MLHEHTLKSIKRRLSIRLMRFSPKMHQTRAINKFFLSVLKSPTQIGVDGVINMKPNISCLGPFKLGTRRSWTHRHAMMWIRAQNISMYYVFYSMQDIGIP